MAGRKSDVEVVTLSLTLDVMHAGLLDRAVLSGRYGRNRNEAASFLIREWLGKNLAALEEEYRQLGIDLRSGGAP